MTEISSEELDCLVRSTVSDLGQILVLKISAEQLEATVAKVIARFVSMSDKLRPLAGAERGIVSFDKPRTAALIADRAWSTSFENDREFAFGLSVPIDVRFRTLLAVYNLFDTAPGLPAGEAAGRAFMAIIVRGIAEAYGEKTGTVVAPLYASSTNRDAEYQPGDQAVIVAIVDNLGIVDEDKLTWEQVSEFRRDKDARVAFRRFIHWLDAEMVGRPASYIADEVSERLERYEWSLRKHGIERIIGALTTTLDAQNLLGASSVGVAVQMISNSPLWSMCAGGGLLVGRAVLSLTTALIERNELKLAQREISYVAEVKRQLGN